MGSAVISAELSFNINLPLQQEALKLSPIQHQVLYHSTDALEMTKWSARAEVQEKHPASKFARVRNQSFQGADDRTEGIKKLLQHP